MHWQPGTDLQSEWEALCDGRIPVFHNAAYDVAVLNELGIDVPEFECTMIMGYDLNPNMKLIRTIGKEPSRYGLEAWGVRLGLHKLEAPSFDEWSEEMIPYARRDAELTWEVFKFVAPKLFNDFVAWEHYHNIDKPFINIIIELNQTGLYIDTDRLADWMDELQPEIDRLFARMEELTDDYWFPGKTTWHKSMHPHRGDGYYTGLHDGTKGYQFCFYGMFNPNSHHHVRQAYKVLYDVDVESTESEYLGENFYHLEFTDVFTQYRKLSKLLGTYCKPFKEKRDEFGYVRGDWKQLLITGRISCESPSLQVLPSRDELGATFRKFIVSPHPEWIIVGVDLSNIELRVLASLMATYFLERRGYIPDDVQAMIDVFNNDPDTPEGDYHGVMAKMWNIGRKQSKSVTFGRIYGSGLRKFASQLKITIKEAKQLRANADKYNPSFKEFHEWVIDEFYEGRGLSHTMFGRRLVYPSFNLDPRCTELQELPTGEFIAPDEVSGAMARGERQAFNAKIQGTAADVLKMICNITAPIVWEYGGRLLAQVHDELLFLIPRSSSVPFLTELVHAFNNSHTLPHVPIFGTPKIGDSWYEVH